MNREAPETIEIRRGRRTLVYRLARELVCIERPGAPAGCQPVLELREEGLVVVRAEIVPAESPRPGETSPESCRIEQRAHRPEDAPIDAAARELRAVRAKMPAGTSAAASPDSAGAPRSRPVYRLEGGTAAFVPTGRLFVRLERGRNLGDTSDAIASLGFELERVNEWAPHSGSLRAKSGAIGEALGRLEELRARLAAESVEPELLTARR
jgi:hypothetical protein